MAFARAAIGIAILLLCCPRDALAGKRVALVIGNSDYALATLANPRNDADDVAAALQRLQFEVAERKDLAVREFDQTIDEFIPRAKDADVALFFFSGHGVQIDKRGYLAPTDVKAESESSALRELVAIQEVVSRIENAAKASVIVLDACRDSPLQERFRRIATERNKALVPPKGLPPVSIVGSNTLVVYATVPGETASDGSGRNSPFTTALLTNIETPGLEIELMFKHVTADVLSATGGKQQPERLSRLQNELILQPASAETKLQSPVSEAEREWAKIKDLKDVATFEAFRKQYGAANPLYDRLASQQIEKLKREQTAAISPLAADLYDGTYDVQQACEGMRSVGPYTYHYTAKVDGGQLTASYRHPSSSTIYLDGPLNSDGTFNIDAHGQVGGGAASQYTAMNARAGTQFHYRVIGKFNAPGHGAGERTDGLRKCHFTFNRTGSAAAPR